MLTVRSFDRYQEAMEGSQAGHMIHAGDGMEETGAERGLASLGSSIDTY